MKRNVQTLSQKKAALKKEIERAEKSLRNLDVNKGFCQKSLIHALDVYQAELEMQNFELEERNIENQTLRDHYYTLFTHLPLPAFTIDSKLCITESNIRAKASLPENWLAKQGVSLLRVFDYNSINTLKSALTESKQSKFACEVTLNYQHGQSNKVFNAHLSCIDGTSFPEKYLLVLKDVTVEQELKEQTSMFYYLLQSMSSTLIILNLEGEVTEFSPNIFHLFPRLITPNKNSLLSEIPMVIAEAIEHYVQKEIGYLHETELLLEVSGGTLNPPKWLRVKLFAIYSDNDLIGCGCMLDDETTRIEHEHELGLAFRIFNQGSQALIVTDKNQRIQQVNLAFEKITGYSKEEVIGKTPAILRSGKHSDEFYQSLWESLKEKGNWEGEIWNKRKNGNVYPQWISISSYPVNSKTPSHYIAVFRDISDQKSQEKKISKLAYFDSLTGCGNRRLLEHHIEQFMGGNSEQGIVAFFVDLDFFKDVNDVHGHSVGDQLLRGVSHRIVQTIRSTDQIYRLGGDEFLIIFRELPSYEIEKKAQSLLELISRPFTIEKKQLSISVSIGIARYPEDADGFEKLLQYADTALYQAKESGRRQYKTFEKPDLDLVKRRVRLEDELRFAFSREEFSLLLMPQVSCREGIADRAEALLRWNSKTFGCISPSEFIPLAEKSGLIHNITEFVLNEAFRYLGHLQSLGIANYFISINVSAVDLMDSQFFKILHSTMLDNHRLCSRLTIELTESVFVRDCNKLAKRIQTVKEQGVEVSIDDFGTGFSSLKRLAELEVDELKIDREFVENLLKSERAKCICQSIIALSRSLECRCVAEGVENEAQMNWLKQAGCDYIQGYYYSKPISYDQLLAFNLSSR